MQASPQATPKWPGNRFGFVPALPGALPSTTFSLGTGPRLGGWREGKILYPHSTAGQAAAVTRGAIPYSQVVSKPLCYCF